LDGELSTCELGSDLDALGNSSAIIYF